MDDSETFGNKKYHDDKPATAVGDCPDPLKGACASKPKLEAFLEGPVDCGGRGWFCRILEEPGWNPVALTSDVNFGYCNTTEGYEDEGWDKSGHCHGSDADETFYWWVRDHWHRGYVSNYLDKIVMSVELFSSILLTCVAFTLLQTLYRTVVSAVAAAGKTRSRRDSSSIVVITVVW
jgi:hypothetical protein